jgi:hypothetical protein
MLWVVARLPVMAVWDLLMGDEDPGRSLRRKDGSALRPAAQSWSDLQDHAGLSSNQARAHHQHSAHLAYRSTLNPEAITSRSWARSLREFSGQDGIVEYSINTRGKGRGNLPMSKDEQSYISKTFDVLDRLTGLDFVRVSSGSQSDIRVHCARRLGGSEGLAVRRYERFDVYWKDKKGWDITRFEKHLIRHEIGHTLGLDHPYGRGAHPRYDTKDSVMSYNWLGNTTYTSTDIRALQGLWGA